MVRIQKRVRPEQVLLHGLRCYRCSGAEEEKRTEKGEKEERRRRKKVRPPRCSLLSLVERRRGGEEKRSSRWAEAPSAASIRGRSCGQSFCSWRKLLSLSLLPSFVALGSMWQSAEVEANAKMKRDRPFPCEPFPFVTLVRCQFSLEPTGSYQFEPGLDHRFGPVLQTLIDGKEHCFK